MDVATTNGVYGRIKEWRVSKNFKALSFVWLAERLNVE